MKKARKKVPLIDEETQDTVFERITTELYLTAIKHFEDNRSKRVVLSVDNRREPDMIEKLNSGYNVVYGVEGIICARAWLKSNTSLDSAPGMMNYEFSFRPYAANFRALVRKGTVPEANLEKSPEVILKFSRRRSGFVPNSGSEHYPNRTYRIPGRRR